MPASRSNSKYVVEYQLTEQEIVAEWFRLRMLRTRTILIYGALFILGLLIVVADHRSPIGWVMLAFPIVFLTFFRLALRRVVKRNAAMTAPRSLTFDAQRLVFASGSTRNEFEWGEVRRFSESKGYYYLHLGEKGTVADIPKSAFAEEQREAFLSCTREISRN